MQDIMQVVMAQRTRLKSVRERLQATLVSDTPRNQQFRSFYVAAVNYIHLAMQRLHAQDQRMGERLHDRLKGVDDNSVKNMLADLDQRLDRIDPELDRLLDARDDLLTQGPGALGTFEQVARAYAEFQTQTATVQSNRRGSIAELSQQHLSEDDWAYVAGLTAESTAWEVEFYEKVLAQAPVSSSIP